MPVEPLPIESIRSIIKWELQTAPKPLLAAIRGKDRTASDTAMGTLAERIAKRFEGYTILAEVHENPFSRLS